MADAKSVWSWRKIVESGAEVLCVDSRACVRVGNDVSVWFPVNVGLRQGCVMSPWLFNIHIYIYIYILLQSNCIRELMRFQSPSGTTFVGEVLNSTPLVLRTLSIGLS